MSQGPFPERPDIGAFGERALPFETGAARSTIAAGLPGHIHRGRVAPPTCFETSWPAHRRLRTCDRADTERRFGIHLDTYFASELRRLCAPGGPVADGLLDITGSGLSVTSRGRLFVRSICMHFDKYLPVNPPQPAFSRTI